MLQEEYGDSIEVDIFRKPDSDVPEVVMKRRQQDAQAKAAKHCPTEKRQQEAQAMAAITTVLCHSGLPGV